MNPPASAAHRRPPRPLRRGRGEVDRLPPQIAHQMENHYAEQLHRYHNAIDERQADLWSDSDPPF